MARIKLSLPQKVVFSTEIVVRNDDINYGGHMGNERILIYCQEARIRYLMQKKMSEKNILNMSIIMADAAVVYKSEAFFGNQLRIDLSLEDFNEHGFDFIYCFYHLPSEKVMAQAKTGIVFFDYHARKLAKAPAGLKDLLGA